MFQNVAYRPTVYTTGDFTILKLLSLLDLVCMQLLIEFISDVQKFLLNFGLYANTKRLLNTNPPKGDHLACLDGLRFISISWVMLGHILSAEMSFFPITNLAFFTQVSFKFPFHWIGERLNTRRLVPWGQCCFYFRIS